MIEVLTTLKNEMEKLNIPYTFDNWDSDIELPQFIGEISEITNQNEDGKSEYSVILTYINGDKIDITKDENLKLSIVDNDNAILYENKR